MIRDNQYGKADIYTGEDIIASQVIEGFEVNLIEIFGPMPPEVFPKQKESAK